MDMYLVSRFGVRGSLWFAGAVLPIHQSSFITHQQQAWSRHLAEGDHRVGVSKKLPRTLHSALNRCKT